MSGLTVRFRISARQIAAFLAFLLALPAAAQPYLASFETDLPEKKLFLCAFYGEKISLLDSAVTDTKGKTTFTFSASRQPGLYRLMVNRNQFLDFIYNRENISIRMDLGKGQEAPQVLQSEENRVFYKFLSEDHIYRRKIEVLVQISQQYPEKDPFYHHARKEYETLTRERDKKLETLISGNEGSFVSRILRLYREPSMPWELNEQERVEQFREKYLQVVSLKDPALIRTNLLTSKVIDFLSLFPNPQMRQQEAEQAFIKGVDIVMANVKDDSAVFQFLLSYLVGGFEKYKMEVVLTHLYEKYLSESMCEGDVREDELARRLRAYEQLAVGRTGPEVNIADSSGKILSISTLNYDYTLLVFYASWCPHCHDLLKKLPQLRTQFDSLKLGVISITLDTSRTDWINYLKQNRLPWHNGFEGKGWSGPSVKAYNIYATPTMFLLDRKRKIISKPITWMDLTESLGMLKEVK
ncbi:MAG TPA: thioredoxin-like domain-containing protein [Bacteroidales bacterium]|nr:thioredoxin-like domain-containing protein [Bacteroidales bacterium]HSA42945.1 thioredoxin-like domain-containing protein [Bacteroidales bacterium]